MKNKTISEYCRNLYLVLVFDGPEEFNKKLNSFKTKSVINRVAKELEKLLDDKNFCLEGCCKKKM